MGTILVQKSTDQAAEVLQVNRAFNFIVINAGSEDGIQKGAVVNVIRDKRLIGKAVVEKTRQNVAAAIILPEWSTDSIEPGDNITRY